MRIIPFLRGLCATALIFVAAPATAQIQLIPVVSGLSSPLFVGHAGDGSGRLFIVEQEGIIKVLQSGSSTPTVFLNITSRVLEGGERGLLGLAFHPLYASNRRFFVFYTQQTDGALVIAEYLASSTNPDVAGTAERRILQIPDHLANHNGGMLAFGNDGYLYIGVGDGGGSYDPDANAQNLNSLMGKLLRIDVDRTDGGNQYASPSDNPFVGIDGRDEIYSYGLRNPWRFSFDRLTGEPWVGDVGQGAREEVDTPMVSGGNYGWPILEGTVCTPQHPGCSSAGTQLPRFEYTHSGGRCSLTGGYVYRGSSGTMPSGGYVYGDYCTGEIFSWDGSQQTLLLDTSALISSFGEDEQGELYVVDLNGSVSRVATSISDPHITSPTPGSTLSGPTEQFAWSAGTGVSSVLALCRKLTGSGGHLQPGHGDVAVGDCCRDPDRRAHDLRQILVVSRGLVLCGFPVHGRDWRQRAESSDHLSAARIDADRAHAAVHVERGHRCEPLLALSGQFTGRSRHLQRRPGVRVERHGKRHPD